MANPGDCLSFAAVCSLLDKLEALRIEYHAPGIINFTKRDFGIRKQSLVSQWNAYYTAVILKDNHSVLATLSLLFPDLHTARVYTLREHALDGVIGRVAAKHEARAGV